MTPDQLAEAIRRDLPDGTVNMAIRLEDDGPSTVETAAAFYDTVRAAAERALKESRRSYVYRFVPGGLGR